MPDGYGLDQSEIETLDRYLQKASTALGMENFREQASVEGFLTTEAVSQYQNVEETVEETVVALTKFIDIHYANVVEATQNFINRAHATITTTAEGVARAGVEYRVAEEEVAEWVNRHAPDGD
ncbi:hypothetical protein [Saccharomonospora halophila]|uniref:hypothetical protein n=1 Tax=Saccharomonospora halophila TaxID=129922 RepID=UPI0003696C86|nr:hypothetical protein [Saccharomonospora halophila]